MASRTQKMTSAIGRNSRGFTVIEILVALLLVSLFTGMAVVGVRSITRARMKETANQLVGLIRDTYNRAALSNKVHRIVFDMDKNTYWVEVSNDVVHVKGDQSEVDRDEGAQVDWNSDGDSIKKAPAFKPVENDEVGTKQKLADDVRFWRIWVGHIRDRVTKGRVELNFFPDGYTEKAHITFSDDEDGEHTLTIVTQPLTGEAVIENTEPEIEKL